MLPYSENCNMGLSCTAIPAKFETRNSRPLPKLQNQKIFESMPESAPVTTCRCPPSATPIKKSAQTTPPSSTPCPNSPCETSPTPGPSQASTVAPQAFIPPPFEATFELIRFPLSVHQF